MLIKISSGNSKLGDIPNVSLIPGKDCGNCTSCVKGCYAVKSYRQYPNVRTAWGNNSELARKDRESYMNQVRNYLSCNHPEYFRWHIAGDILDQDYLESMKSIAREFPNIKFLAFTKMHHLKFLRIPKNLSIIASLWPGLDLHKNASKLPKAWMQDGTESRVPKTAIPCPGECEQCFMCWVLPQVGKDVVFKKH